MADNREGNMRLNAICAVASVALCYTAAAQQPPPPDRVFVLHSHPTGQCPALDWHIGIDDDTGILSGMIAWGDQMQSVAHVTGKVNGDRTFTMRAQEVGGQNRTGEITGRVRDDGWMVADFTGPNISCSGITVPWFRQGGGG
jgi:hypothetical protein